MSPDLAAQVHNRAEASGIGHDAALLLITGSLATPNAVQGPTDEAVRARMAATGISEAAARLLIGPQPQL
jgi:hypothetical protein